MGDAKPINYAGPTGREHPGEHWNARIIREQSGVAGIPAADRANLATLNEVSVAIHRAVEAVKREPGRLGGAFAAGSYPVEALDDIVRVALRAVVPLIVEEHDADRAQTQELMARANETIQLLAWLHAEAAWCEEMARRAWDRSTAVVRRLEERLHYRTVAENKLRGAYAVAMAEVQDLRAKHATEVMATVSLLRSAAAKALERGDQDRADRLAMAAEDHASEGCSVMLADCTAVRHAVETLAEYRAADQALGYQVGKEVVRGSGPWGGESRG